MTSRTVPGSSFRRVIDRNARTVPMDVVVGRYSCGWAIAMVIASMGSGKLADAAIACCTERNFHAASAPPTSSTTRINAIDPIQPRPDET